MENKYISEKMRAIVPYEPHMEKCEIKLDANENNYGLSLKAKEEMADAFRALEINRYPDPMAGRLCKAFADTFQIDEGQVMAGNGSDEIISLLTGFFMEQSDSLLSFSPDFSMYGFYAKVIGRGSVEIRKDEPFKLTKEMILEAAQREKPRILYFSNPCNPTGEGLLKEDVLEIARKAQCIVVVDEAYMDFWNQSVISDAENFDNLIVLRTLSKAYSLAGARVGFAVSNSQLINELKKAKSPFNVGLASQMMGEIALKHEGETKENIRKILSTREWMKERLEELKNEYPGELTIYESKANFIFLKAKRAQEIFESLKLKKILIRNFGGGFLRFSIGTREEMERFFEVFKEAVKK